MDYRDSLTDGYKFSEYRVIPVTRWMVTKYEGFKHSNGKESGSSPRQIGTEYPNADTAFEVATALARQETEMRGLPIDSMGVIYPTHPDQLNAMDAQNPSI